MNEGGVSESRDGKRDVTITPKALAHKIESLQKDRKKHVNKMKGLIPAMKELMKKDENAPKVISQLQTLTELLNTSVNLHQTLIPLLPEHEKVTQNEWF